jgi:biofilm PGA synthesis N-glycosyltransferase PgaC
MTDFLNDMTLSAKIAFLVFYAAFLVQILYWLTIYIRLLFHKPVNAEITRVPVSVIICARNEEENLRNNLPLILEQDYPDFEVVVINDCSTDGTEKYLEKLREEYPVLKYTTIKEDKKFRHGKKLALTIGIKAAQHDLLLLTDADCRPESNHWIAVMQRNFSEGTDITLGYGGYSEKKGLLNTVIRFETLYIAMQYFNYALAGIPYMGVGRNLAYRKDLFFENKGFARHSHLVSGDDDLFINEVSRRRNTRIEISQDSHTRSESAKTWKEWYFQKRRHLTTGPAYKFLIKFLLSIEVISRLLFYAGFVFLLATEIDLYLAILIPFLVRTVIFIMMFKITGVRLNEKHLLLPSLILDVILPLFNIFILCINYVEVKRSRWR